jgi:hypothetical protein
MADIHYSNSGGVGPQGPVGAKGDVGPAGTSVIPTTGTFNPTFTDASGTFAGSITQTGNYTRIGNIIFFCINVSFSGYTNLGTGQYQVTLPFSAKQTMTNRAGTLHNPNTDSRYHIAGITDITDISTISKLFYSGSTTDLAWKYSTPVNWAHQTTHFDFSGFYETDAV